MTATLHPDRVGDLTAALAPDSVAIGASDNPKKVGGRPLMYLSKFDFRGRVYPINPSRDTVEGWKSYADLTDLPESRAASRGGV